MRKRYAYFYWNIIKSFGFDWYDLLIHTILFPIFAVLPYKCTNTEINSFASNCSCVQWIPIEPHCAMYCCICWPLKQSFATARDVRCGAFCHEQGNTTTRGCVVSYREVDWYAFQSVSCHLICSTQGSLCSLYWTSSCSLNLLCIYDLWDDADLLQARLWQSIARSPMYDVATWY